MTHGRPIGLGQGRRQRPLEGQAAEARSRRAVDMTIKGPSGSLTLKNILVGEVWVCSGQSNMEMGIGGVQQRQGRDRRGQLPANPPVLRGTTTAAGAGHRRARATGARAARRRCRGRLGRFFGGGLLLRPHAAPGAEGAGRPDPYFMGRHPGRVLDQPQGAGSDPALKSCWHGRDAGRCTTA